MPVLNEFDSLRIPATLGGRGRLSRFAAPLRAESILEATNWPTGPDPEHSVFTEIYATASHVIGVAKPGKEAARTGDRINANDMLPTVRDRNGTGVDYVPGFGELFRQLFQLNAASRESLALIGALAFRNAYMLDHVRDEAGRLRYQPPPDVLSEIASGAPVITSGDLVLPVDAYLFVLEVLALQEDTKYWTLRTGVDGDVGRVNNLRTYVHVIAACLGVEHPFDVGAALIRGVAPYGIAKTYDLLPLLRPRTP